MRTALIGVLFLANAAAAPQEARPNLVAIVTDDQGRWAMGAYGNKDIRTPNMDRIAAEGAIFLNAITATPVCSPSRATYLTGLYPTELGITDWIAPEEAARGVGLKAATWPQALQKAGYRTALLGKWHLGEKPEYHPTRLGFDHFFGFLRGGNAPMDPTLEVGGQPTKLKGPLPDLLADEAIRFIRSAKDRPFALCLHFRAPHLPYGPVPEEDRAPYRDLDPAVPQLAGLDVPKLKAETKDYYASITSVDRNLGRLLAALDELGLARNTLVTFTSDHGYNLGRHRVETKGNARWIAGGVGGPTRPNMWETSIRVPLAMRWPAAIKPGTRVEDAVSNLDVFRTVLGALGVPVPEGARARGADCSPLLRGRPIPAREAIFGQYDLHNSALAYMRMVRTPRWKYVRHFRANFMDELYDLEKDPEEDRNLFPRGAAAGSAPQDELRRLQELLADWMKSIEDPLLKDSY